MFSVTGLSARIESRVCAALGFCFKECGMKRFKAAVIGLYEKAKCWIERVDSQIQKLFRKASLTSGVLSLLILGIVIVTQAQQTKIKIKLIFEKEFDHQIEDAAILSEKVIRRVKIHGEIKEIQEEVIYPKAVISKTDIKFLDKNRNVIKHHAIGVGNARFVKSKNGNYVGYYILPHYDAQDSKGKLVLFNSKGEIAWESSNSHHYFISDVGTAVGFDDIEDGFTCNLYFYNSAGSVVKTEFGKSSKSVFPNDCYGAYGFGASFSDDGKYAGVFLQLDWSKESILIFYDSQWSELWKKQLTGIRVEKIYASRKGSYVLVSNSTQSEPYSSFVTLYNKHGNLIGNYSLACALSDLSISPDEEFSAVSAGNNIYVFENKTFSFVWKYTTNNTYNFFSSVGISNKGDKVIAGMNSTVPYSSQNKKYVVLFDKNGREIYIKEIQDTVPTYFDYPMPIVKISPDGDSILFFTKKNLGLLSIDK